MNDTRHFHVKASFEDNADNDKNNQIDLHFRNVEENDVVEILRKPVCEGIQQMTHAKKLTEINVYRKTVMDEAQQVITNNGFSNNRSEKWISESFNKVLNFQNNGVPMDDRPGQRIIQLTLNKNNYQDFRKNDVIPQFQSRGLGKSVFNFEGIEGGAARAGEATVPPTVERNIGINRKHIDKFNGTIKSINVLDPNDPFVKNKFLRYLSQNKVKSSIIAISVMFEIKELMIILMDEHGRTMDKLVVHISEILIKEAGTYITSALACLLPGIGSFVIGILGGLIFGFIGKKVGQLLFSLHPEVAPGEGPPISDYFSFIYGSNNCFGEPLNEYNISTVLGLPKSDYPIRANNVAFKSPSNNDEDAYIRMARQLPK